MRAWERFAGFGRIFTASRRAAFGIALVWAVVAWMRLEQGTWLPWTVQNVLTGLAFFLVFALAWLLGVLGGTLGWFVGRRLGRAAVGASAGVFGFWAGLGVSIGLALTAGRAGPPSPALVLLCFALPLLGPWVATRWLVGPTQRAWNAAHRGLLRLSHLLSERLVLRRPIAFDARGLTLGLLAGLIVAVAAFAGLFRYAEAVMLTQGVRLRNEPIHDAAGPVELSRWISQWTAGTPATPADPGIVVLQIDDRTQGRLLRETSEPAVNALLLRKLARWRSGPVILPLSSTALTTAPTAQPPRFGRRGRAGQRPGPGQRAEEWPRSPAPPSPPLPPGGRSPDRAPSARPNARVRQPSAAVVLNPTGPPLDQAALARSVRDLPVLAAALRANERAVLCLLPLPRPGETAGVWLSPEFMRDLWRSAPVRRVAPLALFAPLLKSGRPIGSADFGPFYVRQVPALHLVDPNGLWALPLVLATEGRRGGVSPPPSRELTGSVMVGGRRLRLAAPGQFLLNVYGSRPGALFPYVSYSAVLAGEPLYDRRVGQWVPPRQFFRDRIVFLDTLNQPSYETPVGPFRATELLATATDNLQTMNVLAPPTPGKELLLLLVCGSLAGHLATRRSPLIGAVRVGMLIVFCWLAVAVLFVWPGVWLPVVSVTVAMGLAYVLVAQVAFTVDEMELERQRRERARYEQEVAIGRAIQTSLMPPGHLRSGPFEIVSRSEPAREVGGDFFNLLPLDGAEGVGSRELGVGTDHPTPYSLLPTPSAPSPGRTAIVLGDVSGKGVQGAMYMTVATTLVEARAEPDVPPEEVLAVANAHLYPKIHRLRMFVTVFYGVLEAATGRIEYASAGQVPPVLVPRGGKPRYQRVQGMPLGARRRTVYERRSVVLAPGDTLVLTSDGFVETRNRRGEMLGYDGFLEMVARHGDAEPQLCLDGLFRSIHDFSGSNEEEDDRTLVVIRHHAPAGE
jgi:serine phosphatase RsbU (regulator of sigma subunit)/CHASE2 domain-containing sensor protein